MATKPPVPNKTFAEVLAARPDQSAERFTVIAKLDDPNGQAVIAEISKSQDYKLCGTLKAVTKRRLYQGQTRC